MPYSRCWIHPSTKNQKGVSEQMLQRLSSEIKTSTIAFSQRKFLVTLENKALSEE
jgi:hypothetical protein